MLHQISWITYSVSIMLLAVMYYLYVGVTFYRHEIRTVFQKFTGRQPALKTAITGDLQIPDYDIMGKAQAEDVDFVSQEELSFAPADYPDDAIPNETSPMENTGKLIGYFSEMISEVKTLIRVINESSESKENFEMLFQLIIQKYPELAGTPYQKQINDYLLSEGAPEFPFSLNETDLINYWLTEQQN
ncbi:hypothetical protein [Mucilaginibacter sp.]|uniref:hypothetical protein n=1 Tax=Mucilaginibacter sp. TaxID=1882438 RepID=UPI0035BBF461